MLKYERMEVYDMYDKELFDKICNVACSSDELEKFVTKIDKQEFDKENSFDKYYKADRILHAINCYENNKIDDRYLACWMCAYNWIIMASDWAQTNDEVTFKELIVWQISEWIDSLSFFQAEDDFYDLDGYKRTFELLDRLYMNEGEWKRVFSHTDENGNNDDDIVLLVTNDKTKEFAKLYDDFDFWNFKTEVEWVEPDEIKKEIGRLKALGYKEIHHGFDE